MRSTIRRATRGHRRAGGAPLPVSMSEVACTDVRGRLHAFLLWESAGPKFFPSHATRDVFNRGDSEPAGLVFAYRLPE